MCLSCLQGGLYDPSRITETVEVTVTTSADSEGGSGNASATAAAVIVPLLVIGVLAILIYLWHRRRTRAGKSAPSQYRWRGSGIGGPLSPQSAELALKMDEKKENSEFQHIQAGSGMASILPTLSPERKQRRAGGARAEERRRKRNQSRTRSISPPFDMQHKASGPADLAKSSAKRSLADQLAAAERAQSRTHTAQATSPPSYDSLQGGSKGVRAKSARKRQKPAPLDLSGAVSAGKVMARQRHRSRAHESREDVPRALQPRVRSLRRKPVPLAPLPKAPHEAAEQLHAPPEKSESPLNRPLSKRNSSDSAGMRPTSTSTFFCKGSEGTVLASPVEQRACSTQPPTRRSNARLVTSVSSQSRLSACTFLTTEPHAKCPPNSLAGSAFTAPGESDEQDTTARRRSARASVATRLSGRNVQGSEQ